jgi:ankyrin repeat protein
MMFYSRKSQQAVVLVALCSAIPCCGQGNPVQPAEPATPTARPTLDQELWSAADKGDAKKLRELLDAGASPDSSDDEGTTALTMVAYDGRLAMVRQLLDHGAKVNVKDKLGYTPLLGALNGGSTAVIKLLIERGADVNIGVNSKSPLHQAISASWDNKKQWTEIVRLMLHRGARVDARDAGLFTPLMATSSVGSLEIARMLIANKARVNEKSFTGATALILASDMHQSNSPEKLAIVRLLLQNGAQRELKTGEGITALMMASRTGATETLRLLIQAGASVTTPEAHKALKMAKERKRSEIVKLIEAALKRASTPDR